MRRGFGPSRGTRRMSQTAAHLVDRVIPHVPMRQWVRVCQLRLPIPLRVLLAAQPELVTPVLQVVQRVVERHLLGHTGLKSDEGQGGAVTLIQRFGSAANLNIHLHCLGLDGVAGLGDGAGLAGRAGCRRRGGAHAAAAAGGGHHLSHRLRCRCQFQAVQDGDYRPPMRQSGFPQASRDRLKSLCAQPKPSVSDVTAQRDPSGATSMVRRRRSSSSMWAMG
jgi:hypothetical protein